MVGEYLGAAAAPNTPFALRENFVEKPMHAWKRWKKAGSHYQARAVRNEMIDERSNNLYEAFQCDTDPNTNAPHCRALVHARKDVAPVSENLRNVKNPDGFKEKAKNAFLRGNRRDKQILSETTELINEAEALERSRSLRANAAAPPQAPPSYDAAVDTRGPGYEAKQEWGYEAPYPPGPNIARDWGMSGPPYGGNASVSMYEESMTSCVGGYDEDHYRDEYEESMTGFVEDDDEYHYRDEYD